MWRRQWQQVIPFFSYPPEVRTIIYTTNVIKSLLNSSDWELDGYIRDMAKEVVLDNGNTAGAMAMTNSDAIDEIYLPFDDLVLADIPLDDVLDIEFDGYVSVVPDIERPYNGDKVDVKVRLIFERKGRICIAEPVCEVVSARLNYDWYGDKREEESSKVPLTQALSDELGLDLAEAQELVDCDCITDDSDDGLVCRYV